ncbi:MAG TPA: Calx-beta domain-containing protein, partial [Chitinophagaceae bacterium]|nr:Calx-beta domain-containing protein [Chitinophagaceae bacterium]
MFITSLILFTGFKKNPEQENILTEKSADTNNHVGISKEPVTVSIAGTTVIQGDKGQRPAKVMVYLSQAATEPASVKYSTKDGSAKAGVDYVSTRGSVTFEPGEVVKWVTVPIIGEVAADPDEDAPVNIDVDLIIELSEPLGCITVTAWAYIRILKNIARNPSILRTANIDAIYDVTFRYTGYVSFMGDNAECPIGRHGVVVLSGLLYGKEKVGKYDDISYTGDLEMMIDMDICSAHRMANGEDRLCRISVDGSGTVFTDLVLYFGSDSTGAFDGRGGYIKIESKDTSSFRKVVDGDCY